MKETKEFEWYNDDTGEKVISSYDMPEVDYKEYKDESVLYLGNLDVSFAKISGKCDSDLAFEILEDSG